MSCQDDCAKLLWQQPIAPGGADRYAVDFTPYLTRWLERDSDVSMGQRFRSKLVAGYEWEATAAGRTGLREPRLPTTIGQPIQDGSAVLTCRELSTDSLLATVSDVDWSTPAGIAASAENLTGQKASALLTVGSGVAKGEYDVLVTATAGELIQSVTGVLKVCR